LVGLHATRTNSGIKAHLVYSAHGEDVDTSIIDGKIVMEHRVLKNVNEREVLEKANEAFLNVFERIKK